MTDAGRTEDVESVWLPDSRARLEIDSVDENLGFED